MSHTIAGHCPDNSQETHQDRHSIRPIGGILNAPGKFVRLEFWVRLGRRWYDYDGDDQAQDIDNSSDRVEVGNP